MKTTERSADLVVIGGGIAGLAAAWTAGDHGCDTVLLEKSDRFGGSVLTHRSEGYRVEGGPHTLLVNEQGVEDFLRKTGLWDRAIDSQDQASKRFIVRRGKPVALPSGPLDFLTRPFLSPWAKGRLILEPLLHGKGPEGEEAIGPWVGRHFGREVQHGLADPFVSGIYAGDPDRISVQSAFPKLAAIADLHPSLFRAFLKHGREMKASGKHRYPRRMMSFPDGLGEMVEHLVESGKFDPLSGVQIDSIHSTSAGWTVNVRLGSNPDAIALTAKRLVVAVPPSALHRLPFAEGIRERLSLFSEVESPPVTTFSLAFKRKDVKHPLDGFGMLCPQRENREALGILFDSSLFPGRAPDDEVLLSVFLGGIRSPEKARLSTEELLQVAVKECRELLGATGAPTFWKSTFWPRAIPQYNLGYARKIEILSQIENTETGLTFAGNARDGVALGSCILSGVTRSQ